MGLIFKLGFRNLIKQRRRNLFLGIGIGFGMMILVIANAFSHGLVDVLINDIVSNAFGHLVVEGLPGNNYYPMIRDKARIVDIIEENIKEEDLLYYAENLGAFGRVIGNGEADNVVVVGISVNTEEEKKEFFDDFFTLVEGNFDDYDSEDIQYPIIISEDKAKSLNVGLHDVIKFKVPMVTGQIQAASLTIIAIANANNTFMDLVFFMEAERVKELLGYKPWESSSLQLALRNPKQTATYYADILHDKLKPEKLSILGKVASEDVHLMAFKNNDEAKGILLDNIELLAGNKEEILSKDGVMISSKLAVALGLGVGDGFELSYPTRYRGDHMEGFKVDGIFQASDKLEGNLILLNEEKIHQTYNHYLPLNRDLNFFQKDSPLYSVLATEWKLMDRSKDSTELMKNYKEEQKIKTKQTKFNVVTMYEGASDILKLEGILNMVTGIAVLVLFLIILIGVVNTLRMTIKERTREIGTVRAIGMRKNDVRNMFMTETLLLTGIACIGGIVLGIIVMQLLGMIEFSVANALSMILKDDHLNFKIDPAGIFFNFILIMAIAAVTAYFPARRAAKMSAVEALRHYE